MQIFLRGIGFKFLLEPAKKHIVLQIAVALLNAILQLLIIEAYNKYQVIWRVK